jgi:putative tricarboxylic transport membrane protein
MSDPTPQERDGGAGGMPAFPVHKVDVIVAAIILALCAFLFWETTNFREIPPGLAQNVPPERFPQLLLIVIAAMALFIPFEHVRKRRQGIDLDKERSDRIRPITFVTALALLVVVLVTPWLGTLPAMVLACALIPVLWGERRFGLIAIYAIALPLAVTLLFVGALDVNFLPGAVGHVFR